MSDTPNVSAVEEQLRQANEEIYKHSLELAVRNKTLSLLRTLYQISILTLPPAELAEKIANTVREALEFELVSIMVYMSDSDTLSPVAISRSERLEQVVIEAHYPFKNYLLTHASTIPILHDVFAGRPAQNASLQDLWGTVFSDNVFEKVTAGGHIKTLSIYPLMLEEKVAGILVFGLNRSYDELNTYEHESISSLVDVVSIALDRANVYEALKATNVKLTQANEQQVVLIHFITHQIKGFLTKSRNIFSLLIDGDYGALSEQAKTAVKVGFESDTKGVETVQEILNAANIRSGKVDYQMMPIDLKPIVEETVRDFKSAADAKGLSLTLDIEGDSFPMSGDRANLVHVVKNLVDNSIKYTQQGNVHAKLSRSDNKIMFEVSDTGVGITPEDMTHLFTEGGHGKDSQKINVESTGFGLYIVKNIVEAHHGTIRAESDGAGKGSRFVVEFPSGA